MSTLVKKNKVVDRVIPHKERPLIQRPNVIPFLFLYAIAFGLNELLFVDRENDFDGFLFILIPFLVLVHVVSFVAIHWSVEYKSFVNFKKVCI